jgi:hypothetical protein
MVALVAAFFLSGCVGLKTRRSSELEAPPPSDSPAVVAQAAGHAVQFPPVQSSWSSSDVRETGVIFAWTLAGSSRLVGDSGCRLRVRHRQTGDTVLLKIDSKQPVSIQALKPGTWDARRLGCGLTRIWDLEGLFRDGFIVKADSISVIGWFVFEFNDRTLVAVREGGRTENTNLASQLVATWPSTGSQLISGFSGKALPSSIESRDEIVRVKASGLDRSDSLLQPLLARFQECASQGMKVDPLRAGTLKFESTFKSGAFSGIRTVGTEHALRDDLVQCIVKAHESFAVPGAGDFTLETVY